MNKNYEYERIVDERKKVSSVIEKLKGEPLVIKYLELCELNDELVSKENELYSEMIRAKNKKVLIKEFQNMCYDYDIVI